MFWFSHFIRLAGPACLLGSGLAHLRWISTACGTSCIGADRWHGGLFSARTIAGRFAWMPTTSPALWAVECDAKRERYGRIRHYLKEMALTASDAWNYSNLSGKLDPLLSAPSTIQSTGSQ